MTEEYHKLVRKMTNNAVYGRVSNFRESSNPNNNRLTLKVIRETCEYIIGRSRSPELLLLFKRVMKTFHDSIISEIINKASIHGRSVSEYVRFLDDINEMREEIDVISILKRMAVATTFIEDDETSSSLQSEKLSLLLYYLQRMALSLDSDSRRSRAFDMKSVYLNQNAIRFVDERKEKVKKIAEDPDSEI